MEKKKVLLRTLIVFVTIGIVAMLVLSGPANALSLGLNSDKTNVIGGENVEFDAVLNVNSNEYPTISTITLILDGPSRKTCAFNVAGQKLTECSGIKGITVSSKNTSIGYGYSLYNYAYEYGPDQIELTYHIIVDTDGYALGTYTTEIKVVSGAIITEKTGSNLTISQESKQKTSSNTHTSLTRYQEMTRLYTGESKHLAASEGDKFSLVSDTYINEMTIDKLNADSVEITFFAKGSNPQTLTMKVGDTKELDLDGDGEIDVSVSIWYLGKDKVTLYVQASKAIIVKKFVSQNVEANIINDGIIEQSVIKTNSDLSDLWILLAFAMADIIILEMVFAVYLMKKQQPRRKRK